MIDYTKVTIVEENFANNLIKDKELNWNIELNDNTNEILKYTAKYQNCIDLYVYPPKYSIIRGSLHKLKERGFHNYSQFTFNEVNSTIESLTGKFNISPEYANLTQFEFGVNVSMPYPPRNFLKRIIAHGTHLPSIERNHLKKYVVRFENTEFDIKIYCKTSQHLLSENILRFEVKSKSKRFLNNTFQSLKDLTIRENYKLLEKVLLDSLDNLVIAEKINKKLLKPRERKIYDTITNPILWEGLRCRTQRFRYKKEYQILCDKYINDSSKEFVKKQIEFTWNELLKK